MKLYAAHQLDFYKVGHADQYPKGTESIYSNFTARSGKHSPVPNAKGIYYGGGQYLFKSFLIDLWQDTFFNQPKDLVIAKYIRRMSAGLSMNITANRLADLHDLGFLPIRIKSLPEGSFVPYKVPFMTMRETISEFAWVSQMLESVISNHIWPFINSMTITAEFLRMYYKYAEMTGGNFDFVPYQTHDFSYRGMFGPQAAAMSGLAALMAGAEGTDTVPALDAAEDYYGAGVYSGQSIPATEHSVMCAGGEQYELETFVRLLTEVYPEGNVSIVSDTWNYWRVMQEFLPKLKPLILARKGTTVFRPDSGDPVNIICGVPFHSNELLRKGTYQHLWDLFGGTINEKGFKVLNPKVNMIYGDSITLARQKEILHKLYIKNFVPGMVLGNGSYVYQGNSTRDTHGLAIKATHVIIDGQPIEIFKDPATDGGTKKSLKGYIHVTKENGEYVAIDQVSEDMEERGLLETVFQDGEIIKETTLTEVRVNVKSNIMKQLHS